MTKPSSFQVLEFLERVASQSFCPNLYFIKVWKVHSVCGLRSHSMSRGYVQEVLKATLQHFLAPSDRGAERKATAGALQMTCAWYTRHEGAMRNLLKAFGGYRGFRWILEFPSHRGRYPSLARDLMIESRQPNF